MCRQSWLQAEILTPTCRTPNVGCMELNEEIPLDVLDRIVPEEFSVPDLIGLAIVERGAPMTLEEIALRLVDLGVDRSVPSLRKSWHALRCLRKNREGKLELIRDETPYSAWRDFCLKVHLRLRDLASKTSRVAIPEPEKPAIDDVSPLTLEEVMHLPWSALPVVLSPRRRLALLTEACGGRIDVERAGALLRRLGISMTEEEIRHCTLGSGPHYLEVIEGKLVLHPDESFRAARHILREALGEKARREEKNREAEEHSREWRRRDAAERDGIRRWYGGTRKAVIRCLFGRQGFGAASVLDPDARTFQDFTDPGELSARLEAAEIIFGIDPYGDLERLGMAAGARRLVDLSPPTKTARLNRSGRTLRITPELILRSTLNISRALGDPRKMNKDLKAESPGKVFRRLQADLKALWRLYEYGCLHGGVRLEWGFLRESCWTGWNVGRLPSIDDVIGEAMEKNEPLEAVLGRTAPGWEDPWSRGIRLRAVGYDRKSFSHEFVAEFLGNGGRETIHFSEIAAIRICPKETASPAPAGPSPAPKGESDEIHWPDQRDDQVS
jgi:hypothetical protein